VSDGAAQRDQAIHPPGGGPAGRLGGTALRIYRIDQQAAAAALEAALALGCTAVLAPASGEAADEPASYARACAKRGLLPMLDFAAATKTAPASWSPIDPRRPLAPPQPASKAAADLGDRAAALAAAGVAGVRLRLGRAPAAQWLRVICRLREAAPRLGLIADAAGADRGAIAALADAGLAGVTSSLPWWDGRARWMAEEYAALKAIAPVIAPLDAPNGALLTQRAKLAAALGVGALVPAEAGDDPEVAEALRNAAAIARELAPIDGALRMLTSAGAPLTALIKADRADLREAEHGLLILLNPDPSREAALDPADYMPAIGADFGPFEPLAPGAARFEPLAPAEVRLLIARRAKAIRARPQPRDAGVLAAAKAARIVIEEIRPRVDGGDFPVKAVVGERVEVEADIFAEGHTTLGVELHWRPTDRAPWRAVPMTPLGNDRWAAGFELERLGRWEFAVEAWADAFGAFAGGLAKKLEAGVAEPVDYLEGRRVIEAALARADGQVGRALQTLLARLEAGPEEARWALLTAPATRALMRRADDRPWRVRSPPVPVDAERLGARFASWYELFPRSQSDSPERHGTFDDVIARLPDIRAMGFDVLYLPPIHPIGRTGRKGRNNSLTAGPDDPGSPYAIGAAEGGHDAVHPELGGLEGFRRLIAAARAQGLEVAIDFAIQCSPDHPWLKEHPGWFDWRPDGTLKFAENPPKKYEDIVNVDFYAADAVPGLWLALRDVVLFWAREGVRLFRVDNPHTKPLPFWEWMIADVRRAYPDAIFLAEAFTRPKLMYRLAKLGFSQSYTYFTWRHTKAELTEYLTELADWPVRAFFRPHFFVNTPDINPYFLQSSGRAGFLIRAALAATLSGLWGVYSGFELLEAEPVPGKEEYAASEKYEVKPRDWNAPGNIKAEIAQLNRIRSGEPALQTHLNVRFYTAFNDQVLYYGKRSPGAADMILVAVSLDPHGPQAADIEVPLWEWGLPDDGAVAVSDLLHERGWVWRGKIQHIALTPDQPYAIWRIQPAEPT
jgi:starch synthase (maltosyl-transferring)